MASGPAELINCHSTFGCADVNGISEMDFKSRTDRQPVYLRWRGKVKGRYLAQRPCASMNGLCHTLQLRGCIWPHLFGLTWVRQTTSFDHVGLALTRLAHTRMLSGPGSRLCLRASAHLIAKREPPHLWPDEQLEREASIPAGLSAAVGAHIGG